MRTRNLAALSAALMAAGMAAPFAATSTAHADEAAPASTAFHQANLKGETGGFGSGLSRTTCDINGDGRDDTVIGDRGWERGAHGQVGAGYVLFGSETVSSGDLSDPARAGAVRIDGPAKTVAAGTWQGWSVTCLGDVNGDGVDDFALGTGSRAYHDVAVIFGARNFTPIDIETLGDRGYIIRDSAALGATAAGNNNFGYWVGRAGDIDGDGLDDVAIGDLLADPQGRSAAGAVWVVKGKATTSAVDVRVQTDQVIKQIDGAKANDRLNVAESVGDVNGDGKDDLVLSAYTAQPWGAEASTAGAAYVVYGGGSTQIDLGADLGTAGYEIRGPIRGRDRMGIAAAKLGDINGDGFDDFIVGADGGNGAGLLGGVAVIRGGATSSTVMVDPTAADNGVFGCADGSSTIDCDDSIKEPRGYWINGAVVNSHFGFSVAGLPDSNGDNRPDLLIGAYDEDPSGAAYVIYSEAERTETLSAAALTPAQGQVLRPTNASGSATATYGRTVGSAGDFDGNGVPDAFVGSQSNAVALILRGTLATDVDLTVGDSVAGKATTVDVAVATRADAGNTDVVGTLAVEFNGAPVEGLSALPVVDGAATITLPAQLAGARNLSVAFNPASAEAFGSSAATESVETVLSTASGRLFLDSRSIVRGEAVSATFVTTKPVTGTVEFVVAGEVVGTSTFADGEAVVELPELEVGTHEVTARFIGSDEWAAFSATQKLTVAKQSVDLAPVTVSKSSVSFGTAVGASLKVPGGEGGKVAFYANGSKVAEETVDSNGTANASLAKLNAGSYNISARFLGTADVAAQATLETTRVTVTKLRTSSVAVTAKKFKKNTRPVITIKVGALSNGQAATGTVKVTAAGKNYTVKVNAASKGVVKVKLAKAKKTVKVKAAFTPSDVRNVSGATSAQIKVKVRK